MNIKKENVSENDLYVYFEMINHINPKSVIDFGPMLKKTGCISRQVKNKEISNDIIMIGIDYLSEIKCDVYEIIYNQLIMSNNWKEKDVCAELAIMIKCGYDETESAFVYCMDRCKYFISDCKIEKINNNQVQVISLDNDVYYLYTFK